MAKNRQKINIIYIDLQQINWTTYQFMLIRFDLKHNYVKFVYFYSKKIVNVIAKFRI